MTTANSGSCTPEPLAALGRADNPPGQDHLGYRAADHNRVLEVLTLALGDNPALAPLTSRAPDEPVVALLDAWAAALDVLSFYQERIANEGFLATATERDSVLHLARAIGYELRPGVAATTWLAFTVVASPGTPTVFPMPAGTRAQSVPGPGEVPQVFETVESIDTRPEWNSMPVQADVPVFPKVGDSLLRLAGTDTNLQPGDPVLVAGGGPNFFDVRRVAATTVVPALAADPIDPVPLVAAHTLVTLDGPIVSNAGNTGVAAGTVEVHVLRQRAGLFGFNAQPWTALPITLRVGELNPYFGVTSSGIGGSILRQGIAGEAIAPGPGEPAIKLPDSAKESDGTKFGSTEINLAATPTDRVLAGAFADRQLTWADALLATGTTTIFLDNIYPRVIKSGWVVLERDGATVARRLTAVTDVPHTDYGLSAKVTRLTLNAPITGFSPKTTTVLAQSEQLALATSPLEATLGAVDHVDLARPGPDLPPGRTVVIAGLGPDGRPEAEVATVDGVDHRDAPLGPTLRLLNQLSGTYLRNTTRVLGNAAKATHGESRAEVVGTGDQRLAFQSFPLKQRPITYARAATPTGSLSTLAIWVGGVRWHEVPTLHGVAPDARVYTVRHDDDGTPRVTFGDGLTGSRLPTGRDNVVATYRMGIGRAADLDTGRISLPVTRPLGLRDVVNPVPAAGSDDPETLDRARVNAPLGVRALGRIVSVTDYAEFARAFAGVGKARADVLWDGDRQVVQLTIAGAGGAPVDATSALATDLRTAIDGARHPTIPVLVAGYEALRLIVTARLKVQSDHRFDTVAAAATVALLDRFSFDRREFAQPVAQSEAVSLLQSVPGVAYVLVEEFRSEGTAGLTALGRLTNRRFRQSILPVIPVAVADALPARRIGNRTLPAQLLVAGTADIDLQEAP